ncbi:MAG: hypothetical protein AAB325_13660 [Pseudomonadota bacterium]
MSDELPKLFSDEEFSEERERRERRESDDRRALERRTEDRRVSPMRGRRSSDGLPESTIEQKFPHIAKRLTLVWCSEACPVYISSLAVADRPGRQGFPAEVMEDLLMLQEINAMLMGKSAVIQEAALPDDWKEALRRKFE